MVDVPDGPGTTKLLGTADSSGTLAVLVVAGDVVRLYPLPSGAQLKIGRAAGAEIVIDEDSLSREHAVIRNRAGRVDVEDLDSSNGTIVRGVRIAPRSPTTIEIGDSVHFGTVFAVLQVRAGTVAERLRPAGAATDELVERIAVSDVSVLILGETGVGKEVMAERLHAASTRRDHPLVKINCAALSSALLESELFGHERGAFTGATKDKAGLVESADGGTLFLDEIGEIDPAVQVKLLRVLEARETQRVGALRPHKVDVRFVAATHRNPSDEIRAGRMRSDLYYRIAAFTLTIQPLRERRDEIVDLATRFVADASARAGRTTSTLAPAARAALLRHAWPGNVRELRNVIERALIFTDGAAIDGPAIELALQHGVDHAVTEAPDADDRRRVTAMLEACGGNQTMAAERLGMSRRSLVYRLQAWGMTRPRRS